MLSMHLPTETLSWIAANPELKQAFLSLNFSRIECQFEEAKLSEDTQDMIEILSARGTKFTSDLLEDLQIFSKARQDHIEIWDDWNSRTRT